MSLITMGTEEVTGILLFEENKRCGLGKLKVSISLGVIR